MSRAEDLTVKEGPRPAATAPTPEPQVTDGHDRELIRRHLALTPRERLEALQSFVDDALRLRLGRPTEVR